MKWEITNKTRNFTAEELINIILNNRGIKTKKDIEAFLHPKLESVTVDSVGIDKRQLTKAIKRINKALEKKEQIVVFGDYDVDGIAGSAVLWETLHGLGANVLPYIPHRIDEGYGLSKTGILSIRQAQDLRNVKLIITVDNGIVANQAVEFATKHGIDVIITDHHVPSKTLPDAYAIVHTTKLCGAGVAYLLSQELKAQIAKRKTEEDKHLELVALATIADMVPLVGANRTLAIYGLKALQKMKRLGLLALFAEAGIDQKAIGVYEVGRMIAPRLNAMGRMESAMDSLRLLCTKDRTRANMLAMKLSKTNRVRQMEMLQAAEHAIQKVKSQPFGFAQGENSKLKSLLFVADKSYQQGVIGLVAGKLVEAFYRPAIVVSIGEKESKASARSVKGFNIIEFLRQHSEYFVNVGGHPMAAGFTIETAKITVLQKALEDAAKQVLTDDHLVRTISIDAALSLEMINQQFFESIKALAPFGMGNYEPVFASKAIVRDVRIMGREGKHLKLRLSSTNDQRQTTSDQLEAVGFGMGERAGEIKVGEEIDIVYSVDENEWNGSRKLQLKLKDIRKY